jgi:NAD(P)-dependent dehydrogenase (short-subunit alcohol dehydrogenase family)
MNVLITGGASGVGEAITRKLASNEANRIWFTYCNSAKKAEELEHELPHCHPIRCDFKDASSLAGLLQKMEGMDLDALVNNAISTAIAKTHFHRIGLDVFRQGFSQNILPIIEITQKAIGRFREKKSGRIITMLSATLAGNPPAGYSEYTAAKAYLHSLAKSWASENAAFGITSNCISPSYMATHLTNDTDERVVAEMISRHPLKRLLTPAEAAEAVQFFLNAPLHINGTNLLINAASEIR